MARNKRRRPPPQRTAAAWVLPGGHDGRFKLYLWALYYGPGAAKSAQMDLVRGFVRRLRRNDPDRDHGIFSARLSIPVVALVSASEGKWDLAVGDAPEDRSGTRVYLGLVVEMASTNAHTSLLALTPPTGMRVLPDPSQHTQRREPALTSACRRIWSAEPAHDDGRSLAPRSRQCSLRPPGGFYERYEGDTGT